MGAGTAGGQMGDEDGGRKAQHRDAVLDPDGSIPMARSI